MGASAEARRDAPLPEVALLAGRPWAQVEGIGRLRLLAAIEEAGDAAVAGHPAVLLHLARALEPGVRVQPRQAALDRLEHLLDGRKDHKRDALRLELTAERAIEAARNADLDRAELLANQVLAAVGEPDEPARYAANGDPYTAVARATEALGRALAWRGDRHSSHLAAGLLLDAAECYRTLGSREWEGAVLVWKGNAVHFQWGDLVGAEVTMRRGLQVMPPESPRRPLLLTFFAEVLATLGRTAEVDAVLDEATELATANDDPAAISYAAWTRARQASLAGDAAGTVRWLMEVERHRADWFTFTTGPTYLADAAEVLDRVGEYAAADDYLARAVERAPDDEFVGQAAALVAARRGDPADALVRLARLAHAPWLEPRLAWRRTLFEAYATLRARRPGAPRLASRAFEQAVEQGGIAVATVGEPALTAILAPLAAAAGNQAAIELLAPGGGVVVRVLGEVRLTGHDGEVIPLPTGAPGALVRLLAVHPAGLSSDEVADALWPGADTETGRRRLRDATFRLRGRCGDIVAREGGRLRLRRAWVDAVAFEEAAARALASGGDRTGDIAAALALCSGDLLPGDLYADWASRPRDRIRRRRLRLLDAASADAEARGSLREACADLEEAIEAEPAEEHRSVRLADLQHRLGQTTAAIRTLERAIDAADELDLPPSPAVRAALVRLRRPAAAERSNGSGPPS